LLIVVVLVQMVPGNQAGEEMLSGWWVEEQRRRGCGRWQEEIVQRVIVPPAWWKKLVRGRHWVQAGLWVAVTGVLLCHVLLSSGPAWAWVMVLIATHQARTAVERGQEVRRTETWWQAVSISVEPVAVTAVEREVTEPKASLSLVEATQIEPDQRAETVAEVKQPAPVPDSPAAVMGQSLAQVVVDLPIGTNLGLLLFGWMLVSGQLLATRGAIFPALQRTGLTDTASRRVWAAFAKGAWQISTLLRRWQNQVEQEGVWHEHRLAGYRVKAADLTGFWRPALQNCPSKHYKAEAGKALPAIVLGVVTRVGQVGAQRVPLPCRFVRADPDDPSEKALIARLLEQVAVTLAQDELVVLDAGFKLKAVLSADLPRYVVRLARNFTARRNYPAEYQGCGRPPENGDVVRPLPRTYKGRTIAATPPDREESWQDGALSLRAEFWDDLVLREEKPGATSFNVVALHDPRYQDPLLLATPLKLTGASLLQFYRDRWPVEQLPLCAKQMLGAARQFVHAPESCQRLPELALLAGAILTYTAAKLPPIPTGFWDRAPKPTPGRLRRALEGQPFPTYLPLPARIRQKASITDHLPKGILGHRRQPKATTAL
jgi:hypothetical protein